MATVVCVLGMHRSGTSAVSRMLNLLGVYLGPEQSMWPAGHANRKGYWEHQGLMALNEELLARFGGRWDLPPAFPPSWHRDAAVEDLRERARHLLATDFASRPLWGWKDPRSCLTLPFWQDVIGPMRYVIAIRNPCAVAASLNRRDAMATAQAERLWLAHVTASLTHSSGHSRTLVFYEDIIRNGQGELRRLAACLGHPDRADDPRVAEAVDEFLDGELCHHRMSMEDLAADGRISYETKAFYLAIKGHAPGRALDLLAAGAMTVNSPELESIREKNQSLTTRLMELTHEHQRLSAEAAALGERFERVAADRDRHSLRSEAVQRQLAEIHESGAWRLVTFWRELIRIPLPLGTKRRRAFNAMLTMLAKTLTWRSAAPSVTDPDAA
jgi:hypothetical protein